jgi:hypothetical protein
LSKRADGIVAAKISVKTLRPLSAEEQRTLVRQLKKTT